MKRPFYLVWSPTGHVPTFQHPTREAAQNEATRLAKKCPGKEFYVLKPTLMAVTDGVRLEACSEEIGWETYAKDAKKNWKPDRLLPKKECCVCKTPFSLKKENRYTTYKQEGPLINMREYQDAIDCPQCGCQNILGPTLPKVKPSKDQEAGDDV